MRWLLLVACLILSACAGPNKNTYIRTSGTGTNFELAKQNAFREAVQIKVGALVLSERESNTYKLVKDDILVYSAGYVEDFKVISTTNINKNVIVTMDVLVSSSKIADSILSRKDNAKVFSGEKMTAQYGTYLEQRSKGNEVLNNLLTSYPNRAYQLKYGPTAFKHDGYGNAVYIVPYELKYNQKWIEGLNETAKLLSDDENGLVGEMLRADVTGRSRRSLGEIKLLGNRYHFNDKYRVESFISTIHTRNQLRINVQFYGDNKLLYSECWTPNGVGGNFYQIDGNTFTIKNANASEKHFLEIKYNTKSQLFNVINTADKINVSVQSREYCNKNKLAVN